MRRKVGLNQFGVKQPCDKTCYGTENEATIRAKGNYRVYYCDECIAWHLSKQSRDKDLYIKRKTRS